MRYIAFGALLALGLNAVTNAAPVSSTQSSVAPKTESQGLTDLTNTIPSSRLEVGERVRIEKRFMNLGEMEASDHRLEAKQQEKLRDKAKEMGKEYEEAARVNEVNQVNAQERAANKYPGDGRKMMLAERPHKEAKERNLLAAADMTKLSECHGHIADSHNSAYKALREESVKKMKTEDYKSHVRAYEGSMSKAREVCSQFPHLRVPTS
ncbi:hypothetical protein FRC14_004491 [Serendipita sp. 396]|nr:hypothetical protein FRC14_004491 [Serendipita sp. 396]KAG8782018.1 hypothetical protein FRC15_007678 [Serendipita sp. 397]KAG8798173.1 hypothetical protein FRC16_007794 [Serendipita sp. 398]KAG8822593.1 hypothetical protein FRC19_005647 [Serendipita sp. 401]KAG8866581.1 hypothetical protein FRC20_008081 [Serendipita sp. 405]KAG9053816.1 hypothetical protein FS842_007054 [Serendipita sp. 407]